MDGQGGGGTALRKPQTVYSPTKHTYLFEQDVIVTLKDMRKEANQLKAEVTVSTGNDPKYYATVNLNSGTTRKSLGKDLAGLYDMANADEWTKALMQIALESTKKFDNRNDDPMKLAAEEMDYGSEVSLLEPLVPMDGMTMHFGNGSAGKSLFVLAQLVTIASGYPVLGVSPAETGNVLLCDWEDSSQTHLERLVAICAGANIPQESLIDTFIYQRMRSSLKESLAGIQELIHKENIKCLAIDSIAMAAGGDPSDASLMIDTMTKAAGLGVPTIMIAHIPKSEIDDEPLGPMGSQYQYNSARSLFRLNKKQELDLDESRVYVTNTKMNRGRLRSRMAWDVEFVNDDKEHMRSVTYTRALANDYEEDMKKPANQMSVKDFLIQTFDENPTSAYSVARLKDLIKEDLGKEIKENSLRNTLSRGKNEGLFYVYKTDDNGTNWWQLAEAAPDAHLLL